MRHRIRPAAAPPEASGATCLRQLALAYGIYISTDDVARWLGHGGGIGTHEDDNSAVLLADTSTGRTHKPLSLPLVLGRSLDLACKRIGLALESFDVEKASPSKSGSSSSSSSSSPSPSTHGNFRDTLVAGLEWSHNRIKAGQPVLLLLQGELVANVLPRKRVAGARHQNSGSGANPLTWCLVESSIENQRERNIAFTLHSSLDETPSLRTSASLHLPSLHRTGPWGGGPHQNQDHKSGSGTAKTAAATTFLAARSRSRSRLGAM